MSTRATREAVTTDTVGDKRFTLTIDGTRHQMTRAQWYAVVEQIVTKCLGGTDIGAMMEWVARRPTRKDER